MSNRPERSFMAGQRSVPRPRPLVGREQLFEDHRDGTYAIIPSWSSFWTPASLSLLSWAPWVPAPPAGRPVEGDLRGCLESGDSAWQPPHCRDAPWGVSGAEKWPVSPQTPRGTRGDCEADPAAPETPHGASLQWGNLFRGTL